MVDFGDKATDKAETTADGHLALTVGNLYKEVSAWLYCKKLAPKTIPSNRDYKNCKKNQGANS